MNRNLFKELMEGFDALAKQREIQELAAAMYELAKQQRAEGMVGKAESLELAGDILQSIAQTHLSEAKNTP
jgi:hypothetical protein